MKVERSGHSYTWKVQFIFFSFKRLLFFLLHIFSFCIKNYYIYDEYRYETIRWLSFLILTYLIVYKLGSTFHYKLLFSVLYLSLSSQIKQNNNTRKNLGNPIICNGHLFFDRQCVILVVDVRLHFSSCLLHRASK